MPKPRKVVKKTKPKEETSLPCPEGHIRNPDTGKCEEIVVPVTGPIEMSEGTIELPILETSDDTTITIAPKPSKREQIDKLLANHPPFYADPTRLQYGTEMWPWLKQLADLLE